MESCIALPFEGFQSRESLWENIENLTVGNKEERSEIREIIGQSLVDETLDLHRELLALHEIWKDFNQSSHVCSPLPEPPFLRENLEKQITVLVELLQQKTLKQGKRMLTAVLSKEEREIVKSVSRGSSAAKKQRLPPSNPQHQNNKQCSRSSSSLSVDTARVLENANVLEIDKLAEVIREDFEDERKHLLSDIEKMQMALIVNKSREVDNIRAVSSPTIKELQHLNNKLEKEVTVLPHKSTINPNTSQNCKSKWTNNFQKTIKLSPSPPSSENTSSYRRPVLTSSGRRASGKLVSAKTLTLPQNIGGLSSEDSISDGLLTTLVDETSASGLNVKQLPGIPQSAGASNSLLDPNGILNKNLHKTMFSHGEGVG